MTISRTISLNMVPVDADLESEHLHDDVVRIRLTRDGVGQVHSVSMMQDYACCDEPDYSFSFGFNEEALTSGSSEEIRVYGGCPPFTWAITGTLISLGSASTEVRTNTITAVSGEYDTVTEIVTVTDSCGNSVSGEVRVCNYPYVEGEEGTPTEDGGTGSVPYYPLCLDKIPESVGYNFLTYCAVILGYEVATTTRKNVTLRYSSAWLPFTVTRAFIANASGYEELEVHGVSFVGTTVVLQIENPVGVFDVGDSIGIITNQDAVEINECKKVALYWVRGGMPWFHFDAALALCYEGQVPDAYEYMEYDELDNVSRACCYGRINGLQDTFPDTPCRIIGYYHRWSPCRGLDFRVRDIIGSESVYRIDCYCGIDHPDLAIVEAGVLEGNILLNIDDCDSACCEGQDEYMLQISGGGSFEKLSLCNYSFGPPEADPCSGVSATIGLYVCLWREYLDIEVTPTCSDEAYISYTTDAMQVGTSQTLSIGFWADGCGYELVLFGGGTLVDNGGGTYTYTAPASNPNCNANATIELYYLCDGGAAPLDSLVIGVYGTSGTAGYIVTTVECTGVSIEKYCREKYNNFGCNGIVNTGYTGTGECNDVWVNCASGDYPYPADLSKCDGCRQAGTIVDLRSPAMIAAGCCPPQLA